MLKTILRAGVVLLALTIAASAEPIKVTLLGTGVPTPRPTSFSASTLVEAGNEKLLFDLGRGSTMQLYKLKIPLGAITASFITHLHSDHLVGLPDMWLTGWLATPWASRKGPMKLYGPKGSVAMAENLTKAFADDIRIRIDDEHLDPEAIRFAAKDIEAGPVYDSNGVRVSAIEVNHGEKIKPSFGYVVEYGGHKVVLSGDTKYDQRVAKAAEGADLLIHEVAVIEPELLVRSPVYKDIQAHHTSPEEAGLIFASARPKLAVYSHIVFGTVKPVADIPEEPLILRTRTSYKGPLLVGRDMMSFAIGDTVEAFAPDGTRLAP
ncbi:MBL fold metallo-hydrolase [Bradyrhizobium sp. CCBAU 53351]|uniref:MBL fold metallo-hydrolase n=1 Tax=Bradyrhizobium sp. CCBAU 53351 TaxID=1325114 RepID=UPI0018886F52|nr:MBL fold metallo-hydrolase [Bradyrhizobium sp. CCBAU 53351]QOZ77740.1 MBL fold metallo-hydrolase [Bradyrhizobium sp. CCBAU 53351]